MKIHLRNIGILVFSLLIAFLLLRHGGAVSGVVDHLERIGPGHSADEKTVGLLALGFICVSLVAIVKLLSQDRSAGRHNRRDDPPEG